MEKKGFITYYSTDGEFGKVVAVATNDANKTITKIKEKNQNDPRRGFHYGKTLKKSIQAYKKYNNIIIPNKTPILEGNAFSLKKADVYRGKYPRIDVETKSTFILQDTLSKRVFDATAYQHVFLHACLRVMKSEGIEKYIEKRPNQVLFLWEYGFARPNKITTKKKLMLMNRYDGKTTKSKDLRALRLVGDLGIELTIKENNI